MPNDTNGASDIFLYNVATTEVTRVNVSANGEQANGESKDAATCEGGEFVAFTSEATNLVNGSNNGKRHVYLKHIPSGVVEVVSQTESGTLSNAVSYKSYMWPYCDGIMYATDGSNLIGNDNNGVRDLLLREITLQPDLSQSTQLGKGFAAAGETLTYTVNLVNSGGKSVAIAYQATLPISVTHISTDGANYNAGSKSVFLARVLEAGESAEIQITVQIDPALTEPTLIALIGALSGGDQDITLTTPTIVNGQNVYLPIVRR